jgi:hypothetical protein
MDHEPSDSRLAKASAGGVDFAIHIAAPSPPPCIENEEPDCVYVTFVAKSLPRGIPASRHACGHTLPYRSDDASGPRLPSLYT